MPDLPLISVALCTYEGERFLREQLESLLAQDYPHLEIVAVDDASRDGTHALLRSYAARDPRLRVHRNAANLGLVRNFETAFRLCRGDLVAPCDQDDVWMPSKLSAMQAALGDAPAVYCDSEIVDEAGRPQGRRLSGRFRMAPVLDPASFLLVNCISGHALLFRRELLGRALPVPEGVLHDWWLAFAACCAGRIEYCDRVLVRYRHHARASTQGRWKGTAPEPPRAGRKLATAVAVEARLRAFAAYPAAPDPVFFETALRLWLGWKEHFVSPRLVAFLLRHRRRIFGFRPDERARHVRYALRYLWGLRLKRLLRPRAYRPAPLRAGTGSAAP
ncbi:MAG TPA: glycosyltransferase family 2 protein [Anaeromyxobacteraceae bacterium]|nr:glycosyltransferase family 2 protein [Anaeromyxobacteraceae bacterium]